MAISDTLSSTDRRHLVSEQLARTTGAPRQARHLTETALRGTELQSVTDVALLVVSELVTNACVHGWSDISFDVFGEPDAVVIEVGDASDREPVLEHWKGRVGGLGLHLVEAVAEDWGWRAYGSGKVVWARVAVPAGT